MDALKIVLAKSIIIIIQISYEICHTSLLIINNCFYVYQILGG